MILTINHNRSSVLFCIYVRICQANKSSMKSFFFIETNVKVYMSVFFSVFDNNDVLVA